MKQYNKIIGMMYSDDGNSFVSSWNTTNTSTGSSTSTQVKLPLISTGTYNFTVNWGDGNSDTITTWNQSQVTHTYSSSGTYTITISGTCIGLQFNNTGDRLKILSISKWGGIKLGTTQGSYFYGCSNLDLTGVTDVLDLTGTTNLSSAFFSYSKSSIARINEWNVSGVTNMTSTFQSATLFNSNISSWNTASVTNMSAMFASAPAFNQNIGGWNVSSVTNFSNMFLFATAFNNGGNSSISGWSIKTTGTVNFSSFFQSASSFNQNIGSWNTSAVTNMASMFQSANSFNQNISSWNVSNVINLSGMFTSNTVFNNGLANGVAGDMLWSVGTATTTIYSMFNGASAFNQNLGVWNLSNCSTLINLFAAATKFNNGGNSSINSWTLKTTGTLDLSFVFACPAFNQNVGSWNTSAVTNMSGMFQNATAFNQNIGGWNVSNVTNFSNFMTGKTSANYSTSNLDAIYNGWSALGGGVKPSITITFGSAKYTSASSAGRAILTGSPNNWTITDGGI